MSFVLSAINLEDMYFREGRDVRYYIDENTLKQTGLFTVKSPSKLESSTFLNGNIRYQEFFYGFHISIDSSGGISFLYSNLNSIKINDKIEIHPVEQGDTKVGIPSFLGMTDSNKFWDIFVSIRSDLLCVRFDKQTLEVVEYVSAKGYYKLIGVSQVTKVEALRRCDRIEYDCGKYLIDSQTCKVLDTFSKDIPYQSIALISEGYFDNKKLHFIKKSGEVKNRVDFVFNNTLVISRYGGNFLVNDKQLLRDHIRDMSLRSITIYEDYYVIGVSTIFGDIDFYADQETLEVYMISPLSDDLDFVEGTFNKEIKKARLVL